MELGKIFANTKYAEENAREIGLSPSLCCRLRAGDRRSRGDWQGERSGGDKDTLPLRAAAAAAAAATSDVLLESVEETIRPASRNCFCRICQIRLVFTGRKIWKIHLPLPIIFNFISANFCEILAKKTQ